jgi:Tfp pilus assembly protein PilZ
LAETRAAKRHRWRLPCEVLSEGSSVRAFVLDLSATGLFVQTAARLRPGADVEVRLQIATLPEPISLRARVARTRQVPTQLTTIAKGGVGLRLRDVPKRYIDAIEKLESGAGLRGADASESNAPAATDRPRFRVRVKQSDGPRSRNIELRAKDAEQARALALREVGKGWEAVGAERV